MIRDFGSGREAYLAIVSARRAHTVPKMQEALGPAFDDATWFVPDAEVDAYYAAGAASVHPAEELCEARNMALLRAWEEGVGCLQLSDDLKKIEQPVWNDQRQKWVAQPLSFDEAVNRMLDALKATGAGLAGVAPTPNPFYYNGNTITPKAFCVGDMFLALGDGPCFDLELRLKEDYDFTLAHIARYGRVARCNDILATFQHRTNVGGAVAYRTVALEQESIRYLRAKWGDAIRDNPRRPNEILLKIR